MDINNAIAEIKKHANISQVCHVEKFECYRENLSGMQQIIVEIYDQGSSEQEKRFSCQATSDTGKIVIGNSGPSINAVLSTMHWYELD